jgi:hypothetical protein
MQGISPDSAVFREKPSRKHPRIQELRDKFPVRTSRELFCASRELIPAFGPEQGISRQIDPLAPTHPTASKAFFVADKKTINAGGLLPPTKPLQTKSLHARVEQIQQADESRRTAEWRLLRSERDTIRRRGFVHSAALWRRRRVAPSGIFVPPRRARLPPRLSLERGHQGVPRRRRTRSSTVIDRVYKYARKSSALTLSSCRA